MTAADLALLALKARENAYAPYSGFAVGAALLCADGRVFTGANVECASFGMTICAERSALCAAVSAGARCFTAVAVAAKTPPWPCGACRQMLMEFSPDMAVYAVAPEGLPMQARLADLLPHAFTPASL